MLIENIANGAINLQQLRNNMYYHSSHGSRHFVCKPKKRLENTLSTLASRSQSARKRLADYTHPSLHTTCTTASLISLCVCMWGEVSYWQ